MIKDYRRKRKKKYFLYINKLKLLQFWLACSMTMAIKYLDSRDCSMSFV